MHTVIFFFICMLDIANTLIMLIRLHNYYELIFVVCIHLSASQNGQQCFCVMCSHQSLLFLPCGSICVLPSYGIICLLPNVWVRLLAHPCSCSGCWHISSDCWFRYGGSLIAAGAPLCVHEFAGNFWNIVCMSVWCVLDDALSSNGHNLFFLVANKIGIGFDVHNCIASEISPPLLWWL